LRRVIRVSPGGRPVSATEWNRVNSIKETESLCPECLRVVPATIYEEGGRVYITKTCPEHGAFSDLYWGDYAQYLRAMEHEHLGTRLDNPRTESRRGCPFDCGICPEHESSTVLGIIDVTNRCNLRCPICFAHAGAAGYLYEPTLEQIREMMADLLSNSPVGAPALQLSGGEPTVREDLPEIVRMAREAGFGHVEVNSNGIRMAESVDYCKELKEAGVATVYLQFDGVTSEPYIRARGHDLLPIKVRALENLRAAGFRSVALVPVLVKGVNDDQIGGIIRFAIEHKDIVRCINFQPVSFVGRIDRREREEMRITIPDLMRLAEEQTDGLIRQTDWYPVPTVQPLTAFARNMTGRGFVDFAAHPHCGMATYLVMDGDGVDPISEYVDVERFLASLEEANAELDRGHRTRAKMAVALASLRNVDLGMFRRHLLPVLMNGDYDNLGSLHHRMIMIGAMHFQDPYNFDLERVRRCVIHYATPDGRIIPFCTMNNIHRRSVESKFAVPIGEGPSTPLYDVKSLVERIRTEQSEAADRHQMLLHDQIMPKSMNG